MDINSLTISNDAVKKELIMPNGEKTGVFLELLGYDHPKVKDYSRSVTIKQMRKMADKKGNVTVNVNNIAEILEENEKDDIKLAAVCIAGWEGLTENGEPLSYSHDAAVKFLSNEGMNWVVDAIKEFCNDRANFIKG